MSLRRFWGAIVCLLIIAITLTFVPRAHAADFNLTTSPLPVLLTTKPAQTITTKLRVQNSGTQAVTLRVDLKKFKANGDSGRPVLLDKQPGDDYFNWVSFSKTSFLAEPQAWNEITMTIKPSANAAFGYYYAVVFSNAGPAPKASKTGSALQGGSAVLVLLDVQAKGEQKKLNVASFSADKKLYEYLPATLNVKVHNTGNIHLSPAGNIFINRGKSTVATLDINPAGGNVLPGTDRTFHASWSDGFPVYEVKLDNGQIVSGAHGLPVKQLKWDLSHANRLRIGHYTAHLLMTYDDGTRDVPIEGDVSFWVVPWKILPIIILAMVLVGIGLYTSLKNLYKKIRK